MPQEKPSAMELAQADSVQQEQIMDNHNKSGAAARCLTVSGKWTANDGLTEFEVSIDHQKARPALLIGTGNRLLDKLFTMLDSDKEYEITIKEV